MTTNDTEREHTMNDRINRRTLILNGGAAAAANECVYQIGDGALGESREGGGHHGRIANADFFLIAPKLE